MLPLSPNEMLLLLANCIVPAVTDDAALPAMAEIPVCAVCAATDNRTY